MWWKCLKHRGQVNKDGRVFTYVENGHCTRSQCYRQSSSITTPVSVTFFSSCLMGIELTPNDNFVLLFMASSFNLLLPFYYKLIFLFVLQIFYFIYS